MTEFKFKVGDKVSWISQSQGTVAKKTGEVAICIPAFTTCKQAMQDFQTNLPAAYSLEFDTFSFRKVDSYLVIVRSENSKAKPKIYWPLTKYLEPVKEPTFA